MHRRDKTYLNILKCITWGKKYWGKPHQLLKITLSVAHLYFVIDQILTLAIFCKKMISRFFSLLNCIHCINILVVYFRYKNIWKTRYYHRNNQYMFLYGMSRMYTISKGDIPHQRKLFLQKLWRLITCRFARKKGIIEYTTNCLLSSRSLSIWRPWKLFSIKRCKCKNEFQFV